MSIIPTLGYLRGTNQDSQKFFTTLPLQKSFVIGSNKTCDIIINEDYISPFHCIIQSRVEGGIVFAYLTDISQNGTYLNGELIGYNQTVILYPSSIISFVSHHLNLFYIQANSKESNFEYEEDMVVPLHPDENELDNKCMISITKRLVGDGVQSSVYLCNISNRLRFQLACKNHKVRSFWSSNMKTLQNELDIMKSNRHPNVLAVISSFEIKNVIRSFSPLYFGGNLKGRIERYYDIEEEDAFFIYYQISSGLNYLHKKGIIHCDLKPDNILLVNNDEKTRAVISDFGLSIKSKEVNYWPDNYGTLIYHSPEIIEQKPFTGKIDIWALGIIVYEMLTKKHPFVTKDFFVKQDSRSDIVKNILEKEPDMSLLEHTSIHAKNTIKDLLQKDPELRNTTDAQKLWGQIHMNRVFYLEYHNVRKDFIRERATWFREEMMEEDESTITYHPDNDPLAEKRILSNFKLPIYDDNFVFRREKESKYTILENHEDQKCLNEERYPTRTLQKKRLSEILKNTSSESFNTSN